MLALGSFYNVHASTANAPNNNVFLLHSQNIYLPSPSFLPEVSEGTANLYASSACTRYISNIGNDANDGQTPDKAWRTFKNVSRLSQGAVICLARGSQFSGPLKLTGGMTVQITELAPRRRFSIQAGWMTRVYSCQVMIMWLKIFISKLGSMGYTSERQTDIHRVISSATTRSRIRLAVCACMVSIT